MEKPLILLAAGGTGGHLFPAEALGVELIKRGLRVRLATDARALRYSGLFTRDNIDVVPSETVRGRSLVALARTVYTLGYGTLVAARLVRRLKPAAVVGFGGYPTLPPLMAARLLGVPGIIHDANAVLGRANRFLSRRSRARRRPSARRCGRQSSRPPPCRLRLPNRTGRCACWWSAAARARGS
jgi:UDP-N-acetylglucosamine--N-acetylmuramyl-(pentapeptide) pyrophosphoryl-undecaprenol N-acetylglucosamine transferase